jgi:DNA polymerase I-like protein with 3'-5' exonuclease and polymerase domains
MLTLTVGCPDPVPFYVPQTAADLAVFARWMHERTAVVLGLDSETNAEDPWSLGFLCRAVQVSDGREAWVIDAQLCAAVAPGELARILRAHPAFVAHFSEAETRFLGRGVPGSVRLGAELPHILDYQVVQAVRWPRTLLPQKDGVDPRLRWTKGLKDSYARHVDPCLQQAEAALHAWFKSNAPKGYRSKELYLKWGFANIPFLQEEYLAYSGMDAVAVARLYRQDIMAANAQELEEIRRELVLQWDIDNMTYRGLPLDAEYVFWLRDQLDAVISAETAWLHPWGIKASGQGDAVASAFERMGVAPLGKTKGGAAQWNRDNLLQLIDSAECPPHARELAEHILAARRAGKFRKNYIEPMLDALSRDGRVRCGFRSIGTVTHRNSAYDPPLQQLPKKDTRVRAAFGGLPGFTVVTCDLAQGEPRVMAGLSGDPKYVAAVNSGDVNNVAATAAYGAAFNPAEGKTAGTASYHMRQSTKAGFLSVCYMAGVAKLSKIMHKPEPDVRDIRSNWHSEYSVMFGRARQMNNQEFVTLPSGRSITLWDRKIVLDDDRIITSADPSRKALNYETQGHQADILKACWLKLRGKWRWALAFLLHDEIMLIVPDALAEEAARDLQNAMTVYIGHGVVMQAEATIEGRTWLPQPDNFDRQELESVDAA